VDGSLCPVDDNLDFVDDPYLGSAARPER